MDKNLIRAVNAHYSMVELLRIHFGVNARVGATLLCPFHTDSRKSAKLYEDNAIYCFTESKMFRPYDLLRVAGLTDDQIFNNLPEEARNIRVNEAKSTINLAEVAELRILYMKANDIKATVDEFYKKFGKVKIG